MYLTGCFVTEDTIVASAEVDDQDEAENEKTALTEEGQRKVIETYWRTTYVRVGGRRAVLWAYGRRAPVADGEGEKLVVVRE